MLTTITCTTYQDYNQSISSPMIVCTWFKIFGLLVYWKILVNLINSCSVTLMYKAKISNFDVWCMSLVAYKRTNCIFPMLFLPIILFELFITSQTLVDPILISSINLREDVSMPLFVSQNLRNKVTEWVIKNFKIPLPVLALSTCQWFPQNFLIPKFIQDPCWAFLMD